jgi:all-trans-8'-apo-beta-carotenal 15,15'-oxygenase
MLTRRESLGLLAGSAAVPLLGDCSTGKAQAAAAPALPPDQRWLAKLAEGLPDEVDYAAEVEGKLPDGLSGTLYRNGPGLFERNGFRKWTILDGDGMIRATTFADGRARFRNRFVRTAKYVAEQDARAFLYPTWTTPAPRFLDNIPCIPSHSQAGVTPVVKAGALYAFDEAGAPWVLNARQLNAEREVDPYEGAPETGPANYKAHTKSDGATGDWILVGERGRINPALHVLVKNRDGKQTRHAVNANPRGSAYFHDFFWADPYVVFHLHPALLSPLPMLAGLRPFADCLDWQPKQGSLLFVVDTSGARPPLTIEIPASWMWHALNAYASGNTIVADFVGYDAPDHFLGPDAAFRMIMDGRAGVATSPGTLRRLTLDLSTGRARLETIAAGPYEFPFIPQRRAGQHHRYGYVASQSKGADQGWFHDGLARVDTERGQPAAFHFGHGYYVGEPVFVPDPGRPIDPAADEDPGWLIAEVLDGRGGTSFLAVFDAMRLDDGPLARVRLRHHLPFSFHGWWEAA